MNRRGFLGSILAAAVAPAIVRADSLMRIVPMSTSIIVPSQSLELERLDERFITKIEAHDIRTDALWRRYELTYRKPDKSLSREFVAVQLPADQVLRLGKAEELKAYALLESRMHAEFGQPLQAWERC